MKTIDISNAPNTPLTTRSSFVNNGKVINHNIQVFFTNFPTPMPFDFDKLNKYHRVLLNSIDPQSPSESVIAVLDNLIDEDAIEAETPKYALVYHQEVGHDNTIFESEPSVFELTWLH